ncbi:MAG: TerC family protein [Caulobacter sp.]|nr:TerC family protein [Vitreoscilla sp.]
MDLLLDPTLWVAFAMLTTLEIVLGIDNIIFLTILVGRLPAAQRDTARRAGLAFAMITRIGLLLSLSWVMGLTTTLFSALGQDISGRDLVLLGGGAFLLWKSASEIFAAVEQREEGGHAGPKQGGASRFWSVIAQIAVVDIVFSLDSVITAVGMVDRVGVMIAAVVASVALMMFAARPIGEFVERHPSIKVLALAFLVMVGMTLAAEAFDVHVPKAVIYAAIGFSLGVELLNIRARAKRAAARAGTGTPLERVGQEASPTT